MQTVCNKKSLLSARGSQHPHPLSLGRLQRPPDDLDFDATTTVDIHAFTMKVAVASHFSSSFSPPSAHLRTAAIVPDLPSHFLQLQRSASPTASSPASLSNSLPPPPRARTHTRGKSTAVGSSAHQNLPQLPPPEEQQVQPVIDFQSSQRSSTLPRSTPVLFHPSLPPNTTAYIPRPLSTFSTSSSSDPPISPVSPTLIIHPPVRLSSLNKLDRMLGKGASTAAISHPRLTPTISTESASTTGSARPLMSYSPCEWRDIHPFHDDRRRSDSDRPASINMFSFPFAAPRPSADVPSRESLPLPWRPREFINRVLGRPPNRVSHARAGSSPPDLHISTKSSFGGSRPSSPLVRPASACETEWDAVDRPPTTNVLSTSERNELLRKNRKLQQVLGETPVPLPFVGGNDVSSYRLQLERLPLSQRRHSYTSPPPPLSWHDQTHSYPIAISPPTPNEMAQTIVHGRRPRPLSSPASPAFFGSFDHPYSPRNNIIDYDQPSTPPFTPMPNKGQEVEFPNAEQTNAMYTVPSPHSLSSFTSTEGSSIAMGYEPEPTSPTHAQKRAKLAKIHRFLGSRVPPHLVLGLPQPLEEALARDLPDPAPEPRTETRRASGNWGEKQGDNRDSWWALWEENEREGGAGGGSGDGDVELRLTGEQRAQCVKRKVKMEKMFGALPPQTLYQPRPPAAPQSQHDDDESYDEKGALSDAASGMSPQYLQHRTSLLSLAMIVESNDKKSLTRMLACYQSGDDDQESLLSSSDSEIDFEDAMEEGSHAHIPRRPSNPGGVRRRSNYSMEQAPTISHAYGSAYAGDWVEPSPDPAEALPIDFNALGFQQRRRRAEKLQRIFGVDYRTLFKEVLDNIENEVKDDRSRGVLSSAELQELLAKLKSLESKRYEPIFDQ